MSGDPSVALASEIITIEVSLSTIVPIPESVPLFVCPDVAVTVIVKFSSTSSKRSSTEGTRTKTPKLPDGIVTVPVASSHVVPPSVLYSIEVLVSVLTLADPSANVRLKSMEKLLA